MTTEKRRLVAALILALALLALAIVVLPTSAAPSGARPLSPDQKLNPCGGEFQINVIPRFPIQDSAISVSYSAVWGSIPTPQHQSHQVMSNVIRLDAIYYVPEVFLPVLWGWGGQVGVGNLPSGTYTVEVYLTRVYTTTAVLPPELCGTLPFTVYEELHQIYLPVVAK